MANFYFILSLCITVQIYLDKEEIYLFESQMISGWVMRTSLSCSYKRKGEKDFIKRKLNIKKRPGQSFSRPCQYSTCNEIKIKQVFCLVISLVRPSLDGRVPVRQTPSVAYCLISLNMYAKKTNGAALRHGDVT